MKKINLIIIIAMLLIVSGCGKSEEVDFNETNTITFHNLIVEMPKAFNVDTGSTTEYMQFYSYNDTENYNSCMLYFAIYDYPSKDMKQAIKEGMFNETDITYSEKNINGNKWSIGYREESNKFNQTYYVINKDDEEYVLNYDDYGSGNKCAEALKVIEKSLKFK